MTDEPNTPPTDGTDNVAPSDTDTPDDLDYFDPEEDTEEPETEGTADEETAEPEGEGADEDADEHAEPEGKPEVALVTLADGTKVTHDELVKGYTRQADYTRKQQEVSNERNLLKANAERLTGITNAFTDHLLSLLPPEPDVGLATSNPAKYTAMMAQYNASVSQIQKLIQLGEQPKRVNDEMRKAEFDRLKADEQTKLVQHLPETGTMEGKRKFFADLREVADEIGFTSAELEGVIDHRVFRLAALAREGLAARKAKVAAKAKAEKAPPVAPRKPGQGAAKANRNAAAKARFDRNPTIQNAAFLDIE